MNWILCEDPGTLCRSYSQWRGAQTRKPKYTFIILISSWQCKYSTKRLLFLSLGTLRRPRIFLWVGQRSKNQGWPKRRRRFYAKRTTSHLLLFQEFSTSSGCNSSSTSTSQHLSWTSPAQERSGELAPRVWCGSPQKPFKKLERGMTVEMRTTVFRDLPEWLEEVTDDPEDTALHAPAHFSQDSDSERPTKVVSKSKSKQHSIYIHFQTDRNCEVYLRTKLTRAPCSRRTGEVLLRAEKFGDLITADHKVLSEESESRNTQPYAVVVQDLATQWIQSYRCKTKTLQETEKSVRKFFEPLQKKQQLFMLTVHQNLVNLVKIYDGITEPQLFIVPRRMASSKRRYFSSVVAIRIGWKDGGLTLWNAVAICEMSKTSWQRENSVWKTIWRTIQRTNTSFWSNGWSSSDFNVRFIKTLSIWQESTTSYISWLWADRGWNLEMRCYDSRIGRSGKIGRIRNFCPWRINAKEVLITQKEDEFIIPVADGTRTHSKAVTNCKERRFQWRTSRRTGRVSTNRIYRWRWSPYRLLVDPSWLTSSIVITMNLKFSSLCRRKKHSLFI